MATLYANEAKGLAPAGTKRRDGVNQGARLRVCRASIKLDLTNTSETATQATAVADGDRILLARIPAGYAFVKAVVTTSVSLGSSTIAIGSLSTAAKYKAAAVLTATNTPTTYALVSALDDGPLAADEDIYLTNTTAALPASDNWLIVDLYFMGR